MYCTLDRPTDCAGEMTKCNRCSDLLCEEHAESGLCLACQKDSAKAAALPAPGTISKKQYDLLLGAASTAAALLRSRIEDLQFRGSSAAMYEKWLQEADQALQEIAALGARIPASEWVKKEAA